ncbi:YrzI family small protein [Neobacillus vireti]
MILNILFLSITLRKHKVSLEDATRNETVEKLYEQHKAFQLSMYHLL